MYAHQLAAVWLELHPEASAAELVAFLEQRAVQAQTTAAEMYVQKEGMTMDDAMAFWARTCDYRDLMRREMSADS